MKSLRKIVIASSLIFVFSAPVHAIDFIAGQITALRVGSDMLVVGLTPPGGVQRVTLAFKTGTNSFDAMTSMLSDAYQANDSVNVQVNSNTGILEFVYPDY
ncbi:MAG: hypothetical protein OEY89_05665 [Gammaproteobacteria bacterium]|nr:hypothetical protein [Gammaproteobacteria bacterium]